MNNSLFVCYSTSRQSDKNSDERFVVRAVYFDEIDALRHAVDHGMKVREIDPGDIIKQLKGEPKPRRKEQPYVNPSREQNPPQNQGSSQAPRDPGQGPTREEQLLAAEEEGFKDIVFPVQTGYPAPGEGPSSFPDGGDIDKRR